MCGAQTSVKKGKQSDVSLITFNVEHNLFRNGSNIGYDYLWIAYIEGNRLRVVRKFTAGRSIVALEIASLHTLNIVL